MLEIKREIGDKMSLWYEEFDQDGLKYGYQIEKILFEEQSKFQKISVIETKTYGRALLIDDLVMISLFITN